MLPLQSWSGRLVCLVWCLAACGCETDYPPACEEWRTPLELNEEGDLVPFTMQEAIRDVSPLEGSITWSPESPASIAGTQTSVRIELEAIEGTVNQVKAKNNAYEGDGAYMCSNGLEADVAVELTSEDGQLDETLSTVLRVWPKDGRPGPMNVETVLFPAPELKGVLRFDSPTELLFSMYRGQERGMVANFAALMPDDPQAGDEPRKEKTSIQLWKLEIE